MFKSGDLVTCIKEFNSCGQIFPVGTVFKISSLIKGEFQPFGTIFWLPNDHFEKLIKESECKSQSGMASFIPKFKKGDRFKRTKEYCDKHDFRSSHIRTDIFIASKDSYLKNGLERVEAAGCSTYWLVTAVEPVLFEPFLKQGDIVYRNKTYCDKVGLSDYWLSHPVEITSNSYIDSEGIEKVWTIDTAVQPITMFTKDKPVPPFVPKIKKGDKIRRTEFQRRTGMDSDEILIAKEDSFLDDSRVERIYDTKYSTYAWRVDNQIELVPFEPTFKKDDILKFGNYVYIVTKDSEMRNSIEYVNLKYPLQNITEHNITSLDKHILYRPV